MRPNKFTGIEGFSKLEVLAYHKKTQDELVVVNSKEDLASPLKFLSENSDFKGLPLDVFKKNPDWVFNE